MIGRSLLDRFVVILMLVLPIVLVAIVLSGSVNLPVEDEWEWADLVSSSHNNALTFEQLWAQHNEHRMLVPELVVVAIDKLRGWDTIEETLLNVTLLVATAWIASMTIRRTIAPERRSAALLVIVPLLLTVRQHENLIWGFQLAWFMVALALFGVVELLTCRRRSSFLFAVAVAFAASYCMASGLLIWPVGLVAILLSARTHAPRWREAGAWIVAGLAAYAIYIHGYIKPSGHPGLQFGVEHPFSFLQYVAAYVGSPFTGGADLVMAQLVGVIGIVAFTVVALRRWKDPNAAPWIALGIFGILGAASTAVGRVGFGTDQALSSRYVTLSTTLWVGLAGMIAQLQIRLLPVRRLAVTALMVVVALLFVRANVHSFHDQLAQKARIAAVYAAALQPDSASDSDLSVLYPSPSLVRARLQRLREIKDGPFLSQPLQR
jgi:hypothetical protein